MPIYLRQSTASQEIPLGPFVDDTDGKTAETGLTIANTDVKLWLSGATTLANKNSGGATHISNGIYYAVLDATDTATVGPLVIFVNIAGALGVKVECVVLHASVFDVMFGSTAPSTYAGADTAGTTTLLSRIGSALTITSGKVTVGTNDDKTGYGLAANAITSGVLDSTAGDELATAVWANATRTLTANPGLDATGIRSAIGMASDNLDTQLATLAGYIDTEIGTITTTVNSIATTTTTTATAVSTISTTTAAIKVKTDQMTFTVANVIDSNTRRINSATVQGTGIESDLWRG